MIIITVPYSCKVLCPKCNVLFRPDLAELDGHRDVCYDIKYARQFPYRIIKG